MMNEHELYMQRCFQLAALSPKHTKSNPMVGAVLVYNNNIIGEGYHQIFGQNHAEINAFQSVKKEVVHLIQHSTLYVSLEPCCHMGKTPPCCHKIIELGIKKVIVSVLDPNPIVSGKGVAYLRENGCEVIAGVSEESGHMLLRKYFANLENRPYTVLKWAQSINGIMGHAQKRLFISNRMTQVLTHKWRSEIDGIMVGKNTIRIDQPKLTNRLYEGDDPVRITYCDTEDDVSNLSLIWKDKKVLFITDSVLEHFDNLQPIILKDKYNLSEAKKALFDQGIFSLLVEGGATMLNSFIEQNAWDEARIIVSQNMLHLGTDVRIMSALLKGKYFTKRRIGDDIIYSVLNPSKI